MRHTSNLTGFQADPAGLTTIELLQAYQYEGSVTVLAVVVEQETNTDAEWNIELAGNDLFAAEQSVAVADTPERFIPDQNQDAHDDVAVRLALDLSTPAGNKDDLNVSVLWDDGR
ncbi:MAG: hypothetical protein R3324_18445 [Halobacteriales archaeon]|nr:hypothetical protein [Halobacteriales archaeon]